MPATAAVNGEKMSTALSEILARRLIGIVRMKRYHHDVEIAEALASGGLTVLEYTMSGEDALDCVAQVRATLGDRVCVGAGTVLTVDQVKAAFTAKVAGMGWKIIDDDNPMVAQLAAILANPMLAGAMGRLVRVGEQRAIQSNDGDIQISGNVRKGADLWMHDLGGGQNTALGRLALAAATGNSATNTAIGYQALQSTTNGGGNTARERIELLGEAHAS